MTGDLYAFFDLDGVIVKGKLLPWAAEFVSMVNSSTKVSPSGTGIKIIVRAKVGDRKKTFVLKDGNGVAHKLEVYDCDRFFAATGNRLEGTPRGIADRQELLNVRRTERTIKLDRPNCLCLWNRVDVYRLFFARVAVDPLLYRKSKSKFR